MKKTSVKKLHFFLHIPVGMCEIVHSLLVFVKYEEEYNVQFSVPLSHRPPPLSFALNVLQSLERTGGDVLRLQIWATDWMRLLLTHSRLEWI